MLQSIGALKSAVTVLGKHNAEFAQAAPRAIGKATSSARGSMAYHVPKG